MPVRTRDYLAQLHTRIFPGVSLVAITKIVGRARAVKHYELPKLIFALQHMTQGRTQRRDTGSHRYKNEISALHHIDIESVPDHANQLDLIANAHVVNNRARANLLLHEHFNIAVFGCTRESKVSRVFAFNTQHRNLPGREVDRLTTMQIERARASRLLTNARDYQ